jgi:hypothetical protein
MCSAVSERDVMRVHGLSNTEAKVQEASAAGVDSGE